MNNAIKQKIAGIQANKDYTVFRARLRLKGCDISKNFTSITRAKKWLNVKRAEIELGIIDELSLSHKYTLADLVDQYIKLVLPLKPKNAVNTKRILLWWKNELGHLLIRDVKPNLISQKRDKLLFELTNRGKKRSPSTVVRYLSSLSHAFSIAVKEWEWLKDNPVFKINKPKESQGRTRFLDSNEKEALLNACYGIDSSNLYAIVVIALSTGMRKGEILNLRWGNICFENQEIHIEDSKNGESRYASLVGHALKLLQNKYGEQKKNDLVFPSKKDALLKIDIRKRWESALNKSKVDNFRFHDLRHTAASYLAMSGASAIEIAIFLGHKTLQMTKKYTHLSKSHIQKTALNLDSKLFKS
jgi:integrase